MPDEADTRGHRRGLGVVSKEHAPVRLVLVPRSKQSNSGVSWVPNRTANSAARPASTDASACWNLYSFVAPVSSSEYKAFSPLPSTCSLKCSSSIRWARGKSE